jgi:hypothetical protein
MMSSKVPPTDKESLIASVSGSNSASLSRQRNMMAPVDMRIMAISLWVRIPRWSASFRALSKYFLVSISKNLQYASLPDLITLAFVLLNNSCLKNLRYGAFFDEKIRHARGIVNVGERAKTTEGEGFTPNLGLGFLIQTYRVSDYKVSPELGNIVTDPWFAEHLPSSDRKLGLGKASPQVSSFSG